MSTQTFLPRSGALALILAALAPLAAQAQSAPEATVPLTERAGPYVGASLGVAGAALRSIGRPESGDPESSGASAKLRVGYWFDRHWGVEASAVRLGRITQQYDTGTWRARGDAFTLTGLGRVALAPDWALIGRLGVTRTRLRDDGSTGDRSGFDQLNGRSTSVVLGGVGLEYALSSQAALTIELDGLGKAGKKAQPVYGGVGVRWAF
jgi:opacity protein-like surface antigen